MIETTNDNWANETRNVFFAEQTDLNENGWLDPWNRPLNKAKCWQEPPTSEGWFPMRTMTRSPEGVVCELVIYNIVLSQYTLNELTKLLCLKFWYGGNAVYPWVNPANEVKNCLCITLDGCVQYKFQVHRNGMLRCVTIKPHRSLELGLKPLQAITAEDLYHRIALINNSKSVPFLQATSPVKIPVDKKGWQYLRAAQQKAEKAKGL